jgi:hypothetical protein
LQHADEITNVFFFGRPGIYFECVQMMFVVVAMYLAVWLTVMVAAAPSVGWLLVSLIPSLVVCAFFFYIVKTAALLKAVTKVDHDVLLEVIEETEASKQLSVELRNKVVKVLLEKGDNAFQELELMYNEIDTNGNNSLSRSEFGEFMELMGISFSRRKWERIYKEIDRNYDNQISLQEFYLFLYPDHDKALAMETKRLKIIHQRVSTRANKLLSSLSPFTTEMSTRRFNLGGSGGGGGGSASATAVLSTSYKAINKFKARSGKSTTPTSADAKKAAAAAAFASAGAATSSAPSSSISFEAKQNGGSGKIGFESSSKFKYQAGEEGAGASAGAVTAASNNPPGVSSADANEVEEL